MSRIIAAVAFCCVMTMPPPASWRRAAPRPDNRTGPGEVDPEPWAVARRVASHGSGVDAARRIVAVRHAAGAEPAPDRAALDRAAWA